MRRPQTCCPTALLSCRDRLGLRLLVVPDSTHLGATRRQDPHSTRRGTDQQQSGAAPLKLLSRSRGVRSAGAGRRRPVVHLRLRRLHLRELVQRRGIGGGTRGGGAEAGRSSWRRGKAAAAGRRRGRSRGARAPSEGGFPRRRRRPLRSVVRARFSRAVGCASCLCAVKTQPTKVNRLCSRRSETLSLAASLWQALGPGVSVGGEGGRSLGPCRR